MSGYGSDLATHYTNPPDLSFRQISGRRAVAEAVARRWITPRGTLVTDSSAGVDLREWIGASVQTSDLYAMASILSTEAQKDERVSDCELTLSLDTSSHTLTVVGSIELADTEETFSLVLEIDDVSASILEPV